MTVHPLHQQPSLKANRLQALSSSLQCGLVSRRFDRAYSSPRKLYHILGDIIDHLYGQNIGVTGIPTFAMIQHIVKFEQDLLTWRASLPQELKQRPWETQLEDEDP